MRDNPVQFAVVREDPLVEAELVDHFKLSNVLLVCSGGCTALSLRALFPDLPITAFDFNIAQLQLAERKLSQLRVYPYDRELFNIQSSQPAGLNQCGNFESLFRGLKGFVYDFILEKDSFNQLICSDKSTFDVQHYVFDNPYWPVAFKLFLHDELLTAMFGKNAIQHSPKGSYPRYFQHAFERGLLSPGRESNYFLHHVFLGYYLNETKSLPPYLGHEHEHHKDITFLHKTLDQIDSLSNYDFIQLSNLMDWMSDFECRQFSKSINQKTESGTIILLRQLNNHRNLQYYFPDFHRLNKLSDNLYAKDRSLFYSSLHVLQRR